MTHKMDMEPAEIQIALKRFGVTQADIARQCDVKDASVNRVIFGYSVSDKIRRAIAAAIRRDVREVWPYTYIILGGPRKPGRPKRGQQPAV